MSLAVIIIIIFMYDPQHSSVRLLPRENAKVSDEKTAVLSSSADLSNTKANREHSSCCVVTSCCIRDSSSSVVILAHKMWWGEQNDRVTML